MKYAERNHGGLQIIGISFISERQKPTLQIPRETLEMKGTGIGILST